MAEGKTYRLALLQGTTQTVIGTFDANGDLTAGTVSVADGTYNVILTENGTGRQNYCTYVQAQPTPDPQLSAVSVNGASLAQNGSTTVESVTAIVASMINAAAGKTYRLVLEKGGTTTVLGTFSNGSLSVGAQTLANGSYTVKLTEDNVAIETWATIVVNAPVVSGFSNVTFNGQAWNSNKAESDYTANVAGNFDGEATHVTLKQYANAPNVGDTVTKNAQTCIAIDNGAFSAGSMMLDVEGNNYLVAIKHGEGQSGNDWTIVDVYPYYVSHYEE